LIQPPPQTGAPPLVDPAPAIDQAACKKSKRVVTGLNGLIADARERVAGARDRAARRRAVKRLMKLRSKLELARLEVADDCTPA
jgi:hypothetical protein